MGLRITKAKKKGTYNVFSTYSDEFLGKGVPRQEVIDFYLAQAKDRALHEIGLWLKQIDEGKDWYNKT